MGLRFDIFSVNDFLKGDLKNAENAFITLTVSDPRLLDFLDTYEGKSDVLRYTLDERTAQASRDDNFISAIRRAVTSACSILHS